MRFFSFFGLFSLAWKHTCFHRVRTLLLVLSLGIGVAIPVATGWVTADFEQTLISRATSTPIVVGSPGSRVDLILSALYFHVDYLQDDQQNNQPKLSYGLIKRLVKDNFAEAIPIHLKHTAANFSIVGTSKNYYLKRNLKLTSGSFPSRLGDCVLGFEAAKTLNLSPGDSLFTDRKGFLNPVGDLPLKMRVTGILAASYSPDDRVIFTEIKTAWLIDGIGHGHFAKKSEDQKHFPAEKHREEKHENFSDTASSSAEEFREVTDENVKSFHFHGKQSEFPLSAILIYPQAEREGILWEGRHQNQSEFIVVHPVEVVQELIFVLVNIRQIIDAIVVALGAVMVILLLLLGSLSLQLRKREMETLHAIGASRSIRIQLMSLDFLIILSLSVPVTILLSWLLVVFGKPFLLQLFV